MASKNKKNQQKELGQYFTKNDLLQQYVFDKVKYKNNELLEPSFGAGHLLKKFIELDNNYPMTICEIDKDIECLFIFNKNQKVILKDFLIIDFEKKFKTIIGNPPYVKMTNGNLYIKFIEKCFDLLDKDGEMIFIVPSDFIKLTSASSILEKMIKEGSFTDFYFPNDERLFDEANIDILVFRYQKDLITNKTKVNDEEMYCNFNNGIITFSKEEQKGKILEELFNVYVGIVSGKDEVYKNNLGNIEVLCDKNKKERFIFTEFFPTKDQTINNYLLENKSKLLERKIIKFTESNWFKWGAPRNIKTIEENKGKDCIYIKNMTRNKEVAFIDKVQYFGGSLLCLIPKVNMDVNKLKEIVNYLNTEEFQKNYIY